MSYTGVWVATAGPDDSVGFACWFARILDTARQMPSAVRVLPGYQVSYISEHASHPGTEVVLHENMAARLDVGRLDVSNTNVKRRC